MVPIRMSRSGFGIARAPHVCDCRRGGPVSALSIAPKTMARLLMLSVPRVSGSLPLSTARDEILDHAEMAADAVARIERRHGDRLDLVEQALARPAARLRPADRRNRPRRACRARRRCAMRFPAGAQPVGAPAAAVGEDACRRPARRWRSPTSPAGTRSSPAPIPGNRRSPARRSTM